MTTPTPPPGPGQPYAGWPPPPQPPRRKPRRGLWITLSVVGALVVLGIIGAASNASQPKPAASPADTSTYDPPPIPGYTPSPDPTFSAETSSAAATTDDTTTAAPTPPKPVTLFQATGTGIRSTRPFGAPGQWTLSYSYDCSNFGYEGNFSISLYDGSELMDIPVNELGKSGKANTEVYQSGQLHLEINSECDWSVRAVG
jgi:hypothetical protein